MAKKKKPANKKKKEPKAEGQELAAGRPSKYQGDFPDRLIEFFDVDPAESVKIIHYHKDGEKVKWIDIKRMPRRLPTLVQFAKHINAGIRTVYDWIDPKHSSYHEEFSQAFTHAAKRLQKDFLIQAAVQGFMAPLTFKFIAVNLTDMRDQSDVAHKVEFDDKPPLTIEEMEEKIKAAKKEGLGGIDHRSIKGGNGGRDNG